MTSFLLILFAAATQFFSAIGYICILACLDTADQRSLFAKCVHAIKIILTYVLGVGSIFGIPAYVYRRYKESISDEVLISFFTAEILVVIFVFFFIKKLNIIFQSYKV